MKFNELSNFNETCEIQELEVDSRSPNASIRNLIKKFKAYYLVHVQDGKNEINSTCDDAGTETLVVQEQPSTEDIQQELADKIKTFRENRISKRDLNEPQQELSSSSLHELHYPNSSDIDSFVSASTAQLEVDEDIHQQNLIEETTVAVTVSGLTLTLLETIFNNFLLN